jgi:hypothetical protein
MLTHTTRWSHAPGNAVVPSRWQATAEFDVRRFVSCQKVLYMGGSVREDVLDDDRLCYLYA